MEQAIEFQRTKMDDNLDEIQAILKANGITLKIAMAKLLEMKAQDSQEEQDTLSLCQALPLGRTGGS